MDNIVIDVDDDKGNNEDNEDNDNDNDNNEDKEDNEDNEDKEDNEDNDRDIEEVPKSNTNKRGPPGSDKASNPKHARVEEPKATPHPRPTPTAITTKCTRVRMLYLLVVYITNNV